MRTAAEQEPPARAITWFLLGATGLLVLVAMTALPVRSDQLVDTDSYMRTVRVQDLWSSGGWYDSVIERSNAPFGENLHWTRPLDLIISGVASVLLAFTGLDQAIHWASVATGPLTFLAAGATWLWAIRPAVSRRALRIAALLLLTQQGLLVYGVAGRADHHLLMVAAFGAAVGFLIRSMLRHTRSAAVGLGVSTAVGLWVGPEFTVLSILLLGLLGIGWVRGAVPASTLTTASGAATVSLLAFLVVERGPGLLELESDRVSLLHLGLLALFFASAVGLSKSTAGANRRAVAGLAALAAMGAYSLGAFPELAGGPGGAVPDSVRTLWLDSVLELYSLWPKSAASARTALAYLGVPAAATCLALGRAWRRRHDPDMVLIATALMSLATLALGLVAFRFVMYAELVAAGVLAAAMTPLLDRQMGRIMLVAAIGAVALIPLLAGSMGPEAQSATGPGCGTGDLATALEPLDSTAIVLANLDAGPEILYRTEVRVVASPYHRNPGIEYWYQAMSSSTEEARARLDERPVTHIAVCPSLDDKWFGAIDGSFYRGLLEGDVPWVTQVEEDDSGVRVFSVDR